MCDHKRFKTRLKMRLPHTESVAAVQVAVLKKKAILLKRIMPYKKTKSLLVCIPDEKVTSSLFFSL